MGQQHSCRLGTVHEEESVSAAAANEIQVRAALKAAVELFIEGERFFSEQDAANWLQLSPARRSELLSAAARCCRDHGYDETIRRIASRLDLAHGHHWDRLMPVRIPVGEWFGGALWHGCEGLYGEGELDGNCTSFSNPEMQWSQERQAWEVKTDWLFHSSDLRDHWDGWTHAAPPDPPPTALDRPLSPRPLRALFPASLEGLQRLQEAIKEHGSGAALGASLGVSQSAVSFRLRSLREKFSKAV
jgi:predicted transcriptional regulator